MISISSMIQRIKTNFPGGISNSIDPTFLTQRITDRFLSEVNPRTLVRSARLINGIGLEKAIDYWTCPDDLIKPVSIIDLQGYKIGKYVPADIYAQITQEQLTNGNFTLNYNPNGSRPINPESYYTIEYVNGKKFIRLKYSDLDAKNNYLLNPSVETTGLFSDGATQTFSLSQYVDLNNKNTIKLTFTPNNTAYTNIPIYDDVIKSLLTDNYDDRFFIVPLYVENTFNLSSVNIRIAGFDNTQTLRDTNLTYSVDVSTLVNGVNYIQIPFNKSGAYNSDYKYYVGISCNTQVSNINYSVNIGSLNVSRLSFFTLKYLSENIYTSPTLGNFQSTFNATTDFLNIDRQLGYIYFWCGCIEFDIITSSNKESKRLAGFYDSLRKAIDDYLLQNPDIEDYPQYDRQPLINRRKSDLYNSAGSYSTIF